VSAGREHRRQIYRRVLEAYLKEEGSRGSPLNDSPSAAPTQFIQATTTDLSGDLSSAQKSSCETSCRSLMCVFWEAVTAGGKPDPPHAPSKLSESKLPEIRLVLCKFREIGIVLSLLSVSKSSCFAPGLMR